MRSVWDDTKRQSAAGVQELKRRMNLDLSDRLGALEQDRSDISNFLHGGPQAPVNDGIPPAAPQNVVVTPVPYHELDVRWDTPPGGDYVAKSVLEVTPQGGSAVTFEGLPLAAYANNLQGGLPHSVRAKLVDRWGLESGWSTVVTATPLRTAAEEVELDTLAAAGRITGLLPNANLAQISDPAKLADAAVKAVANAANKNLLPYNESKADTYDTGAWATVGSGRHAYSNATLSVVADGAGKKWWSHVTTAADGSAAPFGPSNYGQKVAEYYVLSATATNPTGSPTSGRLLVNAYDAAGSLIGSTFTGAYLSIGAGATAQPFVKFQVPSGTTALTWYFQVSQSGATLRFSDVMLEHVLSTTTTPTAYTVPAMYTGALGANLLATIDLVAANAIVANGAFTSAKIVTLVADKIATGTLSAATITLALSGQLVCGPGVTLDATGLTLAPTSAATDPDVDAQYKISSGLAGRGAIHFYDDSALVSGISLVTKAAVTGQKAETWIKNEAQNGNHSYIWMRDSNSSGALWLEGRWGIQLLTAGTTRVKADPGGNLVLTSQTGSETQLSGNVYAGTGSTNGLFINDDNGVKRRIRINAVGSVYSAAS